MEDNKEKESNRYESLASYLDDRSVSADEKVSRSDEELQKLIFLWDECNPPRTDAEEVWNKTRQKIGEKDVPKAVYGRRRSAVMLVCGLVAASLTLLLGFAYFLDREDDSTDEKNRLEQFMLANKAKEDVKEVTLVVSDKKKIELANNSQVAYTQAGQVRVTSDEENETVVTEEAAEPEERKEEEEYNQIIVPKGRRSMIVLADNSKIWINSDSKVIYPRTFGEGKRRIFIEGEVFLKVARNEERPFVVSTSAFEVEVLGTSFNVSARKGNARADVVLVEGAVDVKDHLEKHIRMRPNERVELNETGISKKETVNALDYIHWVDGVWVLDGKPLKEVLRYLTDYYGQAVCCDPSVENEPFYGKLFLNEDLERVLETIRQTLSAAASVPEEVVYIEINE